MIGYGIFFEEFPIYFTMQAQDCTTYTIKKIELLVAFLLREFFVLFFPFSAYTFMNYRLNYVVKS